MRFPPSFHSRRRTKAGCAEAKPLFSPSPPGGWGKPLTSAPQAPVGLTKGAALVGRVLRPGAALVDGVPRHWPAEAEPPVNKRASRIVVVVVNLLLSPGVCAFAVALPFDV